MWDFSFVIPSYFILMVFIIYYLCMPKLPLIKNRMFLTILIVDLISISMDIISTWFDMHYLEYSLALLYTVNIIFFVVFFLRSYLFYAYTQVLINIYPKDKPVEIILCTIPLICSCITAFTAYFNHKLFYFDSNGYNNGPWRDVLYINLFFYVIIPLISIIRHRHMLHRNSELYAAVGFICVLFLGGILRKIFPGILIMDTFALIAIIIIYLSFENPALYIEPRIDVFNTFGLYDYIDEKPDIKDQVFLGMIIHNYQDLRVIYGTRQMDSGLYLIGKYMNKHFKGSKVFYARKGRFVIMTDRHTDIQKHIAEVYYRFSQPWRSLDTEIYLNVNFAILDKSVHSDSLSLMIETLLSKLDTSDTNNNHQLLQVNQRDISANEYSYTVKKAIESAIENNTVEVFFQPLVDAYTEKVVGAEALARIYDEFGEEISPVDFIPLAEKNGSISQIGKQIFCKTCAFIRNNDIQQYGIEWINVNLSPIQFFNTDLPNEYSSITEGLGVDSGFIHLEITESALSDYTVFEKQIRLMTEKGFLFVLDDYGKGYSNLMRLKSCPFINVKLDMDVVRSYCKEPGNIIPNTVNSFKSMGFKVTAEGIESAAMADAMYNIGCDYLQGFYFSKPLRMGEFLRYLESENKNI